MSLYSDIFYTSLVGTKENVIRMLNAAICNVGTGNVIVDGDDLATINKKIEIGAKADLLRRFKVLFISSLSFFNFCISALTRFKESNSLPT